MLTHFEIRKRSPFSISIKETSDAKIHRAPTDSLLSGCDLSSCLLPVIPNPVAFFANGGEGSAFPPSRSAPYLTGKRNSKIIAQDIPSQFAGAGPGMARKKHKKKTAKNGANLGFEPAMWQA